MVRKAPTDLQILNAIYERYYDTFASFSREETGRVAKIFVPIDIGDIASQLKVDGDIVFGRLYYHLERKYGYERSDGTLVHFFALKVGEDRHCVNFPYLSSILASLRQEDRKFRAAISISFASLLVSVTSLLLAIFL